MISTNSPNATSSPESPVGHTHSISLAGHQTDLFGQALAPVSRTAQQAREKLMQIRVISGPNGSTSYASVALSQSLASRLQARLDTVGSMEYRQTWREKVTPLGRLYWEHTASARRTCDKDFIGWPTPSAHGSAGEMSEDLERVGNKWRNKKTGRILQTNLATDAKMLVPWPTPAARDHFPAHTPEYIAAKRAQGHGMSNLNDSVTLVPWPTASARDWKNGQSNQHGKNSRPLNEVAVMAVGPTTKSSTAPTEKRGALNPEFTRWLMGFPAEWGSCGATAMRLCRPLRRSS